MKTPLALAAAVRLGDILEGDDLRQWSQAKPAPVLGSGPALLPPMLPISCLFFELETSFSATRAYHAD